MSPSPSPRARGIRSPRDVHHIDVWLLAAFLCGVLLLLALR